MDEFLSENSPNVRVNISGDPNNSLQELFNPSSQKQQVPWCQRKLPKSFFVPPSSDNSPQSDFVVAHCKANSSPACLEAAMSTSPIQKLPIHAHQKSLDVGSQYYQQLYNENLTKEIKFDPRIPEEYQKWGMTLNELEQAHIKYATRLYGDNHNSSLNVFNSQIDRIPPLLSTVTPTRSISSGSSSSSNRRSLKCPTSIKQHNSKFCSNASSLHPRVTSPNPATGTPPLMSLSLHSHHPSRALPPGGHSIRSGDQHPLVPTIRHQRQHSHGLHTQTARQQPAPVHFRSCSQPVPMPASGLGGIHLQHSTGQSPLFGSSGHPALNQTEDPNNLLLTSPPPPSTMLSGIRPRHSTSGQLVQGLECLRLNTVASSTPQQLVHPQQQLRTGTTTQQQHHSHQGSLDSGVGQSVAGHSTANQTPEHAAVVMFCEQSLTDCNTETMEGISYANEELQAAAFNVLDTIDISDITA